MTAQHRMGEAPGFDFFGHAAMPLAVLDASREVTEANDALTRSVTGGGVVGRPFVSLLRAGDRAQAEARLGAIDVGSSASFEARWERPADASSAVSHTFQVTPRARTRPSISRRWRPRPGAGARRSRCSRASSTPRRSSSGPSRRGGQLHDVGGQGPRSSRLLRGRAGRAQRARTCSKTTLTRRTRSSARSPGRSPGQ